MNDLLNVLKKAKNKCVFKKQEEFLKSLDEIRLFDTSLNLDWDNGAGEEWARFKHEKHGIVYMVNSKIGIIFARKNYLDKIPDILFSKYEVFVTETYDDDEWYINLEELKLEMSEIDWHASEEAVSPDKFSLNDLYFATI